MLVGQRVRVLGAKGDVPGVIGRKAIHLMERKDREKAVMVKKLWIDVGAGSREQLKDLGVRVGDPAVLDSGMVRLAGDRVASRAIDNRVGAFIVLEALRLVAEQGGRAGVVAVATAQEEIGYSGGGAPHERLRSRPRCRDRGGRDPRHGRAGGRQEPGGGA